MTESTARATLFELQSSIGPSYNWLVPQKPVSVHIPFAVIDRLEHEAVESFRSLSSRGSEIGGLLFGTVTPGEVAQVSIEDFEMIPCDYSRGPLYRLADADMSRFDKVILQHGAAGSLAAIGIFRSHTRKGLSLDAEDLAFFDSRFRDPHNIALLVRPFATKASSAGIFIRENGVVHGEASPLEFPFRSSLLTAGKPAGEIPVSASAPAAAPPAAPKPPARAQIVPIASRREATVATPPDTVPVAKTFEPAPVEKPPVASTPAPAPAPPAPAVEEKVAKPPVEVKETKPAVEQKVEKPPAPVENKPPAPKVEAKTAPPVEAKPAKPTENKVAAAPPKVEEKVAKPVVEEKPATAKKVEEPKKAEEKIAKPVVEEKAPLGKTSIPSFGATASSSSPVEEEPAKKSNKMLWIGIGAAVPLLLLVAFLVYPPLLHRGRPSGAPGQDSSALTLRVERTAGELLLTWNRDSDAIRSATHAVLNIADGTQHDNVDMDLTQLRTGSISYAPATGDVVFKMEVTGSNGEKTASESVRALSTRPNPLAGPEGAPTPQPVQQQTPAPAKPGTPVTSLPAATPNTQAATAQQQNPAGQPPAPQAETPVKTPLKAFQAPSLSARLHPATAAELPDAPTMGKMETSSSSSVAGLNMGSVSAPVAPARPAAAPAPPPPAEKKAAVPNSGGQIQQAVLLTRKEPEYPKLARETGAKGVVELVATIGTDGRVKSVKVVHGPPMLQKAASDAVLQWKYKPTMLNGVPVEAQTQVLINFMGGDR